MNRLIDMELKKILKTKIRKRELLLSENEENSLIKDISLKAREDILKDQNYQLETQKLNFKEIIYDKNFYIEKDAFYQAIPILKVLKLNTFIIQELDRSLSTLKDRQSYPVLVPIIYDNKIIKKRPINTDLSIVKHEKIELKPCKIPIFNYRKVINKKQRIIFDNNILKREYTKIKDEDPGFNPKDSPIVIKKSKSMFDKAPDIIEYIFNGIQSISTNLENQVIVYEEDQNDSTIGTFEYILFCIFREFGRKSFKFKSIRNLDDFNKEYIEKWTAERSNEILTLELDHFTDISSFLDEKSLIEILNRYLIENGNILIFLSRNIDTLRKIKELMSNIKLKLRHDISINYFKGKKVNKTLKESFVSLSWGILDLTTFSESINPMILTEHSDERSVGGTLDDLFIKKFRVKYLETLRKLEDSIYPHSTKPHISENGFPESKEHKQLKWFVVMVLTNRLINEKIINEEYTAYDINKFILTEEDAEEELKIKVDVYDSENKEVYEVETLYGTEMGGNMLIEKLIKTIKRFPDHQTYIINIVFENFTFIRHFKRIYSVKYNLNKNLQERLRFLVLDIQKSLLIPGEDLIEKLMENIT